ncbi:transposase [Sphingobacterium chungjuense]|uniref:transposase n=1 Tax=Sphingobacterium chungjuense TaxID=2675553 RepID=UPI00140A3B86|nr:transposase [Sphingobacterium chungjuense]
MKIVKHYSDDFKREVVQHYLSSDDSMQKTADKFKLAVLASVAQWLRKFGGEFRTAVMNKSPEKPKTEMPDTYEDMAKRIKELEEALERERLMNLATNKMIEIAERDLKISIRKKSGAKQTKK